MLRPETFTGLRRCPTNTPAENGISSQTSRQSATRTIGCRHGLTPKLEYTRIRRRLALMFSSTARTTYMHVAFFIVKGGRREMYGASTTRATGQNRAADERKVSARDIPQPRATINLPLRERTNGDSPTREGEGPNAPVETDNEPLIFLHLGEDDCRAHGVRLVLKASLVCPVPVGGFVFFW